MCYWHFLSHLKSHFKQGIKACQQAAFISALLNEVTRFLDKGDNLVLLGLWGETAVWRPSMGAGAHWRAITAHWADKRSGLSPQEKCYVHKRVSSCVVTSWFLFLLGVCLLYLPDPLTLEPFVSEEDSAVTLLIWTHPFGRHRKLPDCFALSQISGCTLTNDSGAYPQADAVIIHHREIANGAKGLPPEPRPRAQKWIWLNYESPSHTPRLWRFEDVFNLTMTYRTDSDVFLPYGYLLPRERNTKSLQNRFTHPLRAPSRSRLLRPRLLAWVVSNWSKSHARVAFYNQLRRYVQVDVFGRAGWPVPGDNASGSVVRLVRSYQFYLSLENSQHTDYITEKLWNALRAGAVPVVLGPSRKNYERFLPSKAFIHVNDFPTVRELARYLLMLRRNPARLRWHLDWRGDYSMHQTAFPVEQYCAACRAVRRTRGRSDVVKNLTRWFNS